MGIIVYNVHIEIASKMTREGIKAMKTLHFIHFIKKMVRFEEMINIYVYLSKFPGPFCLPIFRSVKIRQGPTFE